MSIEWLSMPLKSYSSHSSPLKSWPQLVLGCLFFIGVGGVSAWAKVGENPAPSVIAVATGSLMEWQNYPEKIRAAGDEYEKMKLVAELAQAVEQASDRSSLALSLAKFVDASVDDAYPNIELYPRLQRVHGHEEPTWLSDHGGVTAQAIMALSALERWKSEPSRRQLLQKLADGLSALQRKDRIEYPFGAHLSWEDIEPMAVLEDGAHIPSTYFRSSRASAVQALTQASAVLGDKRLLASAVGEALGMSTHLIIGGRRLESFSPQPEFSQDPLAGIAEVKGLLALYQATGQDLYAKLAALATIWTDGKLEANALEWEPVLADIAQTPAASLLKAKSAGAPISSQIIEAEDGKVVNAPIETVSFKTPSGEAGKLASMGRENTFWMRFDVPTEDDYVFYLTYLQSDVGGGLVSVMMRIDGDKIFQVSLGDVDGRPIMRRKFVDGPRPLRAGPHSFGIRFSGLLMTKPALLDSVIVQPAIERREFTTVEGDRLVLLRNVTGETARTDQSAFLPWPPKQVTVVDGDGNPSQLGYSEERRRRKSFLTLPAYGVAIMRLDPKPAEVD